MRLRHIEVFNAVMQTGSVSAAARMINVTQPAVSRTLQHAELQLGFPLFQRVGGRLRPTVEAQTLYPHVERLFAQLDEVQRLSSNLRAGRSQGELRVLTVLALSYEVMPRAVQLFRQKHPQVLVHHQALHSPQIVSSLVLQEADIGYVFSAVPHLTFPGGRALRAPLLALGMLLWRVPADPRQVAGAGGLQHVEDADPGVRDLEAGLAQVRRFHGNS